MKYSVSDGVYSYDIENILGIFGFEKVKSGADFVLALRGGELVLRGSGLDFCTPLSCSKDELKRRLFRYLEANFGAMTDWGILVGVRPVKLASKLLLEGMSPCDAAEFLISEYLLSRNKARMIVEIAEYENTVALADENVVSLYVSVPFCPSRCRYCSFPMQPLATKQRLLVPYYERLRAELAEMLKMLGELGKTVDCIYFGGGTPSTLSMEMIDELGALLGEYVDARKIKEFTFEAGRSDTTSPELFECLRRNGVDRVSVNPQSFTDAALEFALRPRTQGEFETAFAQARDAGLTINSDIILGLEGESEEAYIRGLEYLVSLAPENITIHSLALKRGSSLFGDSLTDFGGICDAPFKRKVYLSMSERGEALLRAAGYAPYYLYRQKRILANLENVGYTKEGAGCLYNSRIMSERSTIVAVGTGGVSKICFAADGRHEQIAGTRSVEEYIENPEKTRAKLEKIRSLLIPN